MVKISFNVEELSWANELPMYKKNILCAVKETLKTTNFKNLKNTEISFLLTSDKNIKLLNNNYRDKNKSTNVLAFPMNHKEKSNNYLIGDIAISLQKILKESKKFRIQKYKYLSKITIHGVLHLIGFDHQTQKQYIEMKEIEQSILKKIFSR
jgi:probable rRNA maturation factor